MALVIVMVVDISLARTYDLIEKGSTHFLRITIFVFVVFACIISNYLIIAYLGKTDIGHKDIVKFGIITTQRVTRMSQIVITAILATLAFQVVTDQNYSNGLIIAAIWISFGLAITMLGFLTYRFFSWFKSNKNNTILLFSLASAALSINVAFSLAYVSDILVDRPANIMPAYVGSMVQILPHSTTAALNSAYFVSSIISFALLWGAAAVLLHHYSLRLGRLRYWLIIGSPLIFFLGQFVSFFAGFLNAMQISDPVFFVTVVTLVFTLSKPVGGILFGIAFFTLAKNSRQNIVLRNYIIISAFGFVLLYVSNNASDLLVSPFPPFGIASVSFVGLASYLILLGIYSSAVLISEDVKLRRLIRKATVDQPKLLDGVGTAQMKEEIQKRVIRVVKGNSDKLAEKTGVETVTSEDDLKQYIDDVMEEIRTNVARKSPSSTNKSHTNPEGNKQPADSR